MSQLVKVIFDEDNPRLYSYRWTGRVRLAVGDRVLVPASNYSTEPKHATVADETSDYDGPVKNLLGVVVNRQTGELYRPGESPEQTVTTPKPAGW